jgi:hypothetical protein
LHQLEVIIYQSWVTELNHIQWQIIVNSCVSDVLRSYIQI